ncbi:MAG: hypothetical protein IPM29_10355 [Planctomycetes bacterium]|nr:hypothetical protein [Planctomycetota bacterium]
MHPTIAEIAPNAPGQLSHGEGSPLFNWLADEAWNNGEGFPAGTFAPDHGGYRDADHANVQVEHIHPWLDQYSVGGWTLLDGSPEIQQFIGYLRDQPLDPGSQVDDAAFEILAPFNRDHSKPLVVIIGMWPTRATPARLIDENDYGRYPGWLRLDGLVADDPEHPYAAVARPEAGPYLVRNPPAGYQVMFAYIVPRIFGRPMTFEMQRSIQLAKAIDLMLAQQAPSPLLPFNFDPNHPSHQSPAKMAVGGSFGGLTAQLAVLYHGNTFHAASAGAFTGSVRRTMGEQAAYDYIGRGTGMRLHDTSLNLADSLEWGFYLRQLGPGTDYFHASTLVRMRAGELRRPLVWTIGDEDTVSNGVDWLPYLSGTRGIDYRGVLAGPPVVAWTLVDRRGHGEGGTFELPIAGVPGQYADVHLELVPYAHQTRVNSPTVPPPTAPPPTGSADDGSESCYDFELARGRYLAPPGNPWLVRDDLFGTTGEGRTAGQGLGLGIDESLRSWLLPGDAEESLYAGTFDGIVTRYVRNAVTNELDVAAQSEPLGYGAWALAVGELGRSYDGYEGPVVVVGTRRAIHLLRATTLETLSTGPYLLDFEHEAPRRLQIAQVHSTGNARDIVFTTFHGHLMVLRNDLTLLTDLGEPGIVDFVVHDVEAARNLYAYASTSSKVPITLLSMRRHLVNVTLDIGVAQDGVPPPAQVHCWTEYQVGPPYDLGGLRRRRAAQGRGDVRDDEALGEPGDPLFRCAHAPAGDSRVSRRPHQRFLDGPPRHRVRAERPRHRGRLRRPPEELHLVVPEEWRRIRLATHIPARHPAGRAACGGSRRWLVATARGGRGVHDVRTRGLGRRADHRDRRGAGTTVRAAGAGNPGRLRAALLEHQPNARRHVGHGVAVLGVRG